MDGREAAPTHAAGDEGMTTYAVIHLDSSGEVYRNFNRRAAA